MKFQRFLSTLLIAASIMTGGVFTPAHAATSAQSIQFLLSQVRASGTVLSGGKVYFYSAGTTTPKTVWLNRSKATAAANPYTLDANGTAQLYGDGVYRVVIKNANGSTNPANWTTVYDRDNLAFRDITNLAYNVADYASMAAAVTSIGTTTPATLEYATDQTLTANLTVSSNIELAPINGAKVIHGAYTVNYAGPTGKWGRQHIFSGTGTVTGFTGYVMPEWLGAKADWNGSTGTDSGVAINRAFLSLAKGGVVDFDIGRYYSTVQLVTGAVPTVVVGKINSGTADTTLGTSITFAAGTSGLKLRGVGSQVENLTLLSLDNGNTASSAIGLDVWSPKAVGKNVSVQLFGSHGWRFDSTVAGNINLPRLDNCFSHGNGGNGFHINGTDANAGVYTMINATANKGIQIYCKSARNHFIGAHIDSAGIGTQAAFDGSLSNYWNIYVETSSGTGSDFEIGSTSSLGVLDALFYAAPVVTGDTTAMQTWRIYERYSYRQLILSDRNGGYTQGKQWKFLNGVTPGSGDLQFNVAAPDGSGSITAFKLTGDGATMTTTATVKPSATNSKDLGETATRWRDGYFSRDGHFARGIGVHGTTPPTSKPTVSGSRDSNAALESLLNALATYGLITNSTSP